MKNKLSFNRDKESIKDKNPFNKISVDEIIDEGFKDSDLPRVGIIMENISKHEEKHKLDFLASLASDIKK